MTSECAAVAVGIYAEMLELLGLISVGFLVGLGVAVWRR